MTDKSDGLCCVFGEKQQKQTENNRKKVLTNANSCAIIYKHLRVLAKYRGVEQLVARRAHNPEGVGSSPASATMSSGDNGLRYLH